MKRLLSVLFLLLTLHLSAQDDNFDSFSENTGSSQGNTKANLVSELSSIAPGKTVTLAIQLEHGEGWYTYYQNPGGPGLALKFEWQLPDGYSVKKLHWPTPQVYESSGTQFYIYKGKYSILADISIPSDATVGEKVEFKVTPTWQLVTCPTAEVTRHHGRVRRIRPAHRRPWRHTHRAWWIGHS